MLSSSSATLATAASIGERFPRPPHRPPSPLTRPDIAVRAWRSTTCGGAATCDDEKVLFFGNDASHAQVNVTSVTARGFTFGHEYYGTFSRAMFTLFQ